MTLKRVFPPQARLLATASALLLLAACASVPPPTNLMQRAKQQMDAARAARAADYAPVDLTFAKQRYEEAQTAMGAEKYALARDMANESLADGRLAETRAELATARKQIRQQNAENKRLRAQLLNAPASSQSSNGGNGGLPTQIVLPQPAPAASAPAHPASSGRPSTGGSL